MNAICITDQDYQISVIVGKSKMEEYLSPISIKGRGNFCLNLRNRNAKNKNLSKITILDQQQEPSVQLVGRARAVQI